MKQFAVAIDGPAGSGKSTVAKEIARELGILYIDTGAMYRTVAYFCIIQGIDVENEGVVCDALQKMHMKIMVEEGLQRIFLDGDDVTDKIRTQEIGQGASKVAAYEAVRKCLVEIQRDLARNHSVIMDGRDIGTNVLPHAEVKIYLDAGVEERAKRRLGELEQQGRKVDLETVKAEIARRDEQDMHRKLNPLCCAEDALRVDSTAMDITEVKERILAYIEKKVQ